MAGLTTDVMDGDTIIHTVAHVAVPDLVKSVWSNSGHFTPVTARGVAEPDDGQVSDRPFVRQSMLATTR